MRSLFCEELKEKERSITDCLQKLIYFLPSLQSQLVLRCVHFSGSWCFPFTKQIKAGPSLRIVISSRLPQSRRFGRGNEKERDGKRNKKKRAEHRLSGLVSSSSHPKREKSWEHAPLEPFLQDAFNCICLLHLSRAKPGSFLFGYIFITPSKWDKRVYFYPVPLSQLAFWTSGLSETQRARVRESRAAVISSKGTAPERLRSPLACIQENIF